MEKKVTRQPRKPLLFPCFTVFGHLFGVPKKLNLFDEKKTTTSEKWAKKLKTRNRKTLYFPCFFFFFFFLTAKNQELIRGPGGGRLLL